MQYTFNHVFAWGGGGEYKFKLQSIFSGFKIVHQNHIYSPTCLNLGKTACCQNDWLQRETVRALHEFNNSY